MKSCLVLLVSLSILLSACGKELSPVAEVPHLPTFSLTATEIPNEMPAITHTLPATITVAPTETPTLIPTPDYHIGVGQDGKIALNQVDLSNVVNGVPTAELAAEQAYLLAHPEITGQGNGPGFGTTIEGSGVLPWKTLTGRFSSRQLISASEDLNIPGLYELTFVIKAANNDTRALLSIILDPAAQQAYIDAAPPDVKANLLTKIITPQKLQDFIDGKIDFIDIPIFMNSTANAALIDDPAFARVKQVVEAGGADLRQLFVFNQPGRSTTDYENSANTIDSLTFISPYAIIP